jgi:ABC-2 type transport system permease protein
MFSIFKKEINSYFGNMIAYLVIAAFMIATGLFTWVFPESSVLEYGFAEMRSFFSMAPFVFLFVVPAITMRVFAEEFKSGTIELLFTKPLTNWQIVLGKFLAACFVIALMLVFSIIFFYSIYQLGSPKGNIDVAAVIGSYFGLFLIACTFAAIGTLASAFTNNQVVAFVVAVFINFIFYIGFASISSLFEGDLSIFLQNFGLSYHYEALSRGLIDSRNVIYLCSIIVGMLYLTTFRLESIKK